MTTTTGIVGDFSKQHAAGTKTESSEVICSPF